MSNNLADICHAVILGIVQGFTEFLPISSSGHLVLINDVLGLPYYGKTFDLLLHLGSLFAVLYFFRAELGRAGWGMVKFAFSRGCRWPENTEERLGAIVLISMVPTALAGFLLEPLVEPYLQGRGLLAVMLGIFGLLMAWADRRAERLEKQTLYLENMGWKDSLIMGLAQAMAFIPGVSRSGVCLTVARLLGLSRPQAVRLSMMMSIPVISGAVSVKLAAGAIATLDISLQAVWLGICAAAICSWMSLRLLTCLGNVLQLSALYRFVLALALLLSIVVAP